MDEGPKCTCEEKPHICGRHACDCVPTKGFCRKIAGQLRVMDADGKTIKVVKDD